jgi:hypothetical protein
VPAVHEALDQLRTAYSELYGEAEAIAHSTALAARREGLARLPEPAVRHGADRLPHGVRKMVPGRVRRGLRKALGRER